MSSVTEMDLHALIAQQVDAYAEWVRAIRAHKPLQFADPPESDPMRRLAEELRLLAEEIDTREQQLAWLFDIAGAMSRAVVLDEVLEHTFNRFRGLIPYDRIGCALLSDDGRVLKARWARSDLGDVKLSVGYSQVLAGSSLEEVLRTGQPRIINDLEAYLANKPTSNSTRRIVDEGGRSSLTCPLIIDGVPLGFLFFTSRQPNAYTEHHQSLFRQIASQVSAVIQRSQLHEELVQRNRALIERTRELQVVATTDALTRVLNRRALTDLLEAKWTGFVREHKAFGLVMCDVDHFKMINDTHGHDAGDVVLRTVAERMGGAARRHDQLGRWGGEEFLLVVDGCDECAELRPIAERLRAAIAAAPIPAGAQIHVTASFGAAASTGFTSLADLLRAADRALYAAKHGGRDRVVTAAEDLVA